MMTTLQPNSSINLSSLSPLNAPSTQLPFDDDESCSSYDEYCGDDSEYSTLTDNSMSSFDPDLSDYTDIIEFRNSAVEQRFGERERLSLDELAKGMVDIDGVDHQNDVKSSFLRVRNLLHTPASNLNVFLKMFADEGDDFSSESESESESESDLEYEQLYRKSTRATYSIGDGKSKLRSQSSMNPQLGMEMKAPTNSIQELSSMLDRLVHETPKIVSKEGVLVKPSLPKQRSVEERRSASCPRQRGVARRKSCDSIPRMPVRTSACPPRKPMRLRSRPPVTKSVRFDKVLVRHFECVLGDNPTRSSGPSISIGWKYQQAEPTTVDGWERERYDQRRKRTTELIMSRKKREHIAQMLGYSKAEIAENARRVKKVNSRRTRTVDQLTVVALGLAEEGSSYSSSN